MSTPHPQDGPAEPANLRLLRRLVTGLTLVLIVGLIVITGVIVMAFLSARGTDPGTLADITVPANQRVQAVTFGQAWTAVVTRDDGGKEYIHILDPSTGVIRQTVDILNE